MRLDVQLLIYVYMGICVSLLIFNLCYIFADAAKERRAKNPGGSFRHLQKSVQTFALSGQITKKEHLKNQRLLSHVTQLEQFHWAVEKLMQELPEETAAYLCACEGDFRYLALVYQKKDDLQKAYFARLLELYGMGRGETYDELKKILVEMACSPSVYTRENALRVLYHSGNTEAVVHAFLQMSRREVFHYGKLLTDGLLSFSGDQKQLVRELWTHRHELLDNYLLAVMQFIRMSQEGYEEEFKKLLEDDSQEQELRLEALRYFRRYRYEPIYPILLHMMENTQEIGWEYQAVTALTLANYPGAETEKVLKAALCHTNWYVRYNAADTLVAAFGNESHRFSDVLEGDDRYAREILLYMLEHAGHRKGDAGK